MNGIDLISSDLFDRVLKQPAISGRFTKLLVVAGYATPAMVSTFLAMLEDLRIEISIELLVGMVGAEGISQSNHEGFLQLQETFGNERLQVSYTSNDWSVHHKLYIWVGPDELPELAFAGSANFTQNGFLLGPKWSTHGEVLVRTDPILALAEYRRVERFCVFSTYFAIENEVRIYSTSNQPDLDIARTDGVGYESDQLNGVESVILPLVALTSSHKGTVRGEPHTTWGLNWGQREGRKNRSEAVIPIPAKVRRQFPEFFPVGKPGDRPQFQVTADDHKALFLKVAEGGDKALHSVPSNAALGEYFRNRLGLPEDSRVVLDDLKSFGSRFVRIFKTEEEANYALVFSPELEQEGCAYFGLDPM